MDFSIVDVFSQGKYTGNQLAVFRGSPSDEMMQTLALEMNYSETTFITSDTPENGGYNVRIFTCAQELPFAGHPTLGTAYIIRRDIIGRPVGEVVLNLKVGQIPVRFDDDGTIWMRQKPPKFGAVYDRQAIADALSIPVGSIDNRFPIQESNTGVPFIIAPLKSLADVRQARLNPEKLISAMSPEGATNGLHAILIFAPETVHEANDLHARVLIFDDLGTDEDAATGSANGCLAGYLVHHRFFGTDHIKTRVEQGYQIQRPSLLLLDASDKGDHIEVNVGGRVDMVARGTLVD